MKMMIQRLKDAALGEVHYVSRVHYAPKLQAYSA